MVERFFRDLTVNRLRRGVFHSLPELISALQKYIKHTIANQSPLFGQQPRTTSSRKSHEPEKTPETSKVTLIAKRFISTRFCRDQPLSLRRRKNSMKLKQDHFRKLFRAEREPATLYPIGEKVEDALPILVEFLPDASGALDLEWINSIVADPVHLEQLLQKAFAEYCSPAWCGVEARKAVFEELSDNSLYGKGETAYFKKHGFPRYLEIRSIHFDRTKGEVLFNGSVEVDMNLAEHGVSIRVVEDEVHFGYGADHDSEED